MKYCTFVFKDFVGFFRTPFYAPGEVSCNACRLCYIKEAIDFVSTIPTHNNKQNIQYHWLSIQDIHIDLICSVQKKSGCILYILLMIIIYDIKPILVL